VIYGLDEGTAAGLGTKGGQAFSFGFSAEGVSSRSGNGFTKLGPPPAVWSLQTETSGKRSMLFEDQFSSNKVKAEYLSLLRPKGMSDTSGTSLVRETVRS
jgi:hypothetical protein